MNETITTAIALIALVSGLVLLILFVRRDSFAGPGTGHVTGDELGALIGGRRRPTASLR